MKKIILLVIAYILFVPFMANAEEKYTITYDANDGTGRTKVVEVDNINKVKMPGVSIFKNLNDDPEDPLDDKIIYSWNMNAGEDISTHSKTRFHLDYTYDLNNYFNDSIKQNKKYNKSQKYQSRNKETLNYNNLNDSVKQSQVIKES